MATSLPTGWQEHDSADHDATRYNPQPISRFEHERTGAGVRLSPAEPTTGTGSGTGPDDEGEDDRAEYQVSVGTDGASDPGEMERLTGASDHADALGIAREFMSEYNERCIENGEDLDTLVSEHRESDRGA